MSGEIRAVCFGETVDRLDPLIVEGRVYTISRGSLKANKSKAYSQIQNEYEMTLDQNTLVTPEEGDAGDIPQTRFNVRHFFSIFLQCPFSVVKRALVRPFPRPSACRPAHQFRKIADLEGIAPGAILDIVGVVISINEAVRFSPFFWALSITRATLLGSIAPLE